MQQICGNGKHRGGQCQEKGNKKGRMLGASCLSASEGNPALSDHALPAFNQIVHHRRISQGGGVAKLSKSSAAIL
ncbi:hypothetical protein VU06_04900, partial [Desulfobulbus sp. F3]|nr:hypothetical protein [Desulfobulbus sp. F3]